MDGPRMFAYAGCGTCRKARVWLREHGVVFEEIPIRDRPPSAAELGRLLAAKGGNRRALLNTSGGDYRVPGIKEQLASMGEREFLQLLAQRGNLIKRPIFVSHGALLVGFDLSEWQQALGFEH